MEQGNMLELVILTQEGEFIGSMEAFGIKEKTPEIGLWLKRSAHGKGYGYEALKGLLDHLNATGKHRLTRAHREKQLKMSCQALHNAPPNRT